MIQTTVFIAASLWAFAGYADETSKMFETPGQQQIFELNWQNSARCLNDFTVTLKLESETQPDGSMTLANETDQDGELIPKFSPLAKEAFLLLKDLKVGALRPDDYLVRTVYWKEDGQEKHIGFEFTMSFKLDLPKTVLNSNRPLTPDNANVPEFKTSYEIMRALHALEAKSANSKYLVFKNWGLPVRLSCQTEKAGITGSSK